MPVKTLRITLNVKGKEIVIGGHSVGISRPSYTSSLVALWHLIRVDTHGAVIPSCNLYFLLFADVWKRVHLSADLSGYSFADICSMNIYAVHNKND